MIIQAKNIKKTYPNKSTPALKGVDLSIKANSTHGLVGQSASGKSTLARVIADLATCDKGEILYRGENIKHMDKASYHNYRSNVQFIFQDPQRSMNPTYTIEKVIEEPLLTLKTDLSKSQVSDKTVSILEKVGLNSTYLKRFPHQLSGGQCQRVAIARALVLEPELIIADEVVSALDVSVQAQILNLMKQIQNDFSVSYLFISHDIGIVRYMSDYLTVLYEGEAAEAGDIEEVIHNPQHEHTKTLLQYSLLKQE